MWTSDALTLLAVAGLAISPAYADPKPEDTWPGFRGHDMSGVASTAKIPERWSTTENVRWAVPIAGHGWSSPIVWGDTVFVTSAISSRPFKKPTPGLYGNEYIAEMQAQGLSNDEISKRSAERDGETTAEADEIRYMVYALDARSGRIKWEREAIKTKPFRGRHRKNTYASETPVTDGERLYVSFGQNVGLFVY
jgi:outer membrane protein assembly factor BamB